MCTTPGCPSVVPPGLYAWTIFRICGTQTSAMLGLIRFRGSSRLRVHIVKPSPAYQTRPQAVIHILLEQGMTPTRVAILFTAAAGGAFAMHGLARETAILHVRALVIVHFFSGYRRMGDIHHVVEHRTVNRVPTSSPSQSTSACSARITTWQRLKQPNGGEPVS